MITVLQTRAYQYIYNSTIESIPLHKSRKDTPRVVCNQPIPMMSSTPPAEPNATILLFALSLSLQRDMFASLQSLSAHFLDRIGWAGIESPVVCNKLVVPSYS